MCYVMYVRQEIDEYCVFVSCVKDDIFGGGFLMHIFRYLGKALCLGAVIAGWNALVDLLSA